MTVFRRIAALVCCLLLLMPLSVSAANSAETTALLQQMLNYYYHYQQSGKTDIFRLLDQLEETDPESALVWRGIFEFWYYTLEDMPKNETELPDGLPQDDTLCIVVLGYELEYNGSMKPELEGRLQLALAAAQQYPNATVICTGGGTASGAKGTTEAGQMARWLKNNGVDANRIVTESQSMSTEYNARNVTSILSRQLPQVTDLVLVTSDYHLTRSSTLFYAALQKAGLPVSIRACLGYEAGHEGFAEDPLDQTTQVARIMGLTFQSTKAPTLSRLTEITVTGDTQVPTGQMPVFTVIASYDSGFQRDVTEDCIITDYDPSAQRNQRVRITYQENGSLVSAVMDIQRPEPPTTIPEETTLPEETVAPSESQLPEESTVPLPPAEKPSGEDLKFLLIPGLLLLLIPVVLTVWIIRSIHSKRKNRQNRNESTPGTAH